MDDNGSKRSSDNSEPSAGVHAGAGDALLSLTADASSVAVSTSSATSNVAVHVASHHVKTIPLWRSTTNANRMRWPTRGD